MVRVGTLDDTVRWARVMSELTEVAGKLCPQTAKSIYIEITQRLVVCILSLSSKLFSQKHKTFSWPRSCHWPHARKLISACRAYSHILNYTCRET